MTLATILSPKATKVKWLVIAGTIFLIFGVGGFALYELVYLSFPRRDNALLTDTQSAKFVSDMQAAIGQSLPTMEAVELAIAWAAYESNWGSATGYTKGNNPYNIAQGSAKAGWTGPTVQGLDPGSSTPVQQWRSYPDLASGVADCFGYMLQQGTWTGNTNLKNAWVALQQGDIDGLVAGLHAGVFEEQDAATYQAGISENLPIVQNIMSPSTPDDVTPTVS